MSKTPAIIRPLARYVQFNGRSNRAEFWPFIILIYVVFIAAYGALYTTSLTNGQFNLDLFLPHYLQFSPFIALFDLAIFLPFLAVIVRRLHDINRTGWWVVMPVVVSIVAYFVFFTVKGEELVNLMLNLAPKMEALESSDPSALMNPFSMMKAMLKLEWPIYQMMIPWVLFPSLAAQLLLYAVLAMPGTSGDNRFGPAPGKG